MKVKARVFWRRAFCWSHDLPSANSQEPPRFAVGDVNPAPNYFDETYLELPRSTFGLRGVAALIGGPGLVVSFVGLMYLYWLVLGGDWSLEWFALIVVLQLFPVAMWLIASHVKMDLILPRDEPIRFNRLRRKIYLYQFRFHYIYLFSRKHWGVKPVAYNWDDVTAEVYRVYAPGHGGLIENVMLSVRNPETNEVIDRVFFTHDLYHGEAYWAIARLFMQQGPEALPKFVHPPRDWNDDDGLSHMHCLAPKVHWPEDIDRESRTAPSEGEVL
ncbi:DUF6708 domain-containing protein [Pseudomonas putida]|uniref:DUF6708 domain-containing protein n=2 Tax=Pseudomonas TaxID=286 RepID=UPI001F4D6BDF|nr:DUF6708 domain-containing protein [Pseudomonas putida]